MPRASQGRPNGKARVNPQAVRDTIKAKRLVRQLQQHVDGKRVLTMAQVRAIDILLRKIIPDLSQTNVTGELTHNYVVEVPPLLTKNEWLEKYKTIEHAPRKPQQLPQQPLQQPNVDVPMLPLLPPTKPQ
jgi:hypothetical protein